MPKQGKSPKKKTKEKSPQRTEESEYPEMDQDVYNRLLQNAIEQSKAELQQRHEEQLKAVEERLTRKFDDEVRELSRAFDESRGANPTTRDATWMRDIMTEAVVAANNANLTTQKPYIPNRFLDAIEEQKYSPYIRGDAQLKQLFTYVSEMQIAPYLWTRHWLEYEYGTEYFDALLEEVISVHTDPRTNEEYFCSELNKEQIAEVVYHEGKMFCFTRKGSNWSRFL